jgi:radical SAM/Cys-rich protein
MHATLPLLRDTDFPAIKRAGLKTVQVNVGYRCNQSCLHCHVNAGPKRKEAMSRETTELVLAYLRQSGAEILDITGGAPELNENFRYLVTEARNLGVHVMDRCNLTILNEPGQEDTAEFLAENKIEVIASLPCYLRENVDGQRGKDVFDNSIAGIKKLNALGYGREDSELLLNLVYNPTGPYLPPSQYSLEADYKRELTKFDVSFNNLFTITNMPIARFGSTLVSKNQFDEYMQLLKQSHQDFNLENVMCRSTVSIDWQGYVYDCDFNQMLGIPMPIANKSQPHLRDLMGVNLEGKPIATADHCYGCTAGQGSSCGGALD